MGEMKLGVQNFKPTPASYSYQNLVAFFWGNNGHLYYVNLQ